MLNPNRTLSLMLRLSTRPTMLTMSSSASTSWPSVLDTPGPHNHSRACGNATSAPILSIHHTNTAAASQSALAGTSSYRRCGGSRVSGAPAASWWRCPTTASGSCPLVAAHRAPASVQLQAHQMRGRQIPLDCAPLGGGLLLPKCSLVRSLYT